MAAVLSPANAAAHGLIQRANLPIPEWMFAWAAAVVLIVSFAALAVLWREPRLEQDRWRPLPFSIGRPLGAPALEFLCGVIGVVLLIAVVVSGLAGSQSPLLNFAPTFVFITFWVGMAFASALLGGVFQAFSPWRAIGRAAGWALQRKAPPRQYPDRLGRWPAVAGLLCFAWIELASGWGEEPRTLAVAVLAYTAVTLAAQAVYGVDAWTRCGEAFAVYFDLFARISPFERRGRTVGVRPPLSGLPRLDLVPGTVAFVMVMIGSVTYDGLSSGTLWKDGVGDAAIDAPELTATIGLLLGVALVSGFYALGIAGTRSVGGGMTAQRLRGAFVHSLVPIALVYVFAHYVTFFLFEGQGIIYLASDPLGEGWDLFGTASAAIDYGILSQNDAWYLQVGFVIAGHVAALCLAHDRALVLYSDSRLAARSQYWMLGVMIGFTSLALWLLAAAQG
ncbi:MAG: hypothetical protein QOI31_1422 [Solirubrobacterales bacterium]|jgi:hypothetical protein|nr:hypothetical protein [Solirubrobacterales bacterium]